MSRMTLAQDLSRAAPVAAPSHQRQPGAWLGGWIAHLRAGRRRRRALDTLLQMEDWLLDDLGLFRPELEAARRGTGEISQHDLQIGVRLAAVGGAASWPRNRAG